MRPIFLAALALLVFAGTVRAQVLASEPKPQRLQTERTEASAALREPQPAEIRVLPDAPIAKIAPVKPVTCVDGATALCALLGGMRHRHSVGASFRGEDHPWAQAMKHPVIMISNAMLVGSTIADFETAQMCIHAHTCREGNPLLGQTRAQMYGVGIPVMALSVFASGKLKEQGYGVWATVVPLVSTAAHMLLIQNNLSNANRPIPTVPMSAKRR